MLLRIETWMVATRILLAVLAAASSEGPSVLIEASALAEDYSARPARVLLQQGSQLSSKSEEDASDGRDAIESGEAGFFDGQDEDSAGTYDAEAEEAKEDDSSESFVTLDTEDFKPKGKDKAKVGKGGAKELKDASLIRPNAGNRPEVIEVEVLMRKFMGITFTENVFDADLIVVSRWVDNRTKALLQTKEKKTLSMGPFDAQRTLWMPDIEILNREYDGLDILSSVVQVHADGTVEKIERAHARLKCLFHTNAYPYDMQTLQVKVASNSKMMDDVVLKAIGEGDTPGVLEGAFDKTMDLFSYVSSEVRAYAETDGPLKKSRAALLVTVRRNMASCASTILVPAFCIVSISWAAFYMPCNTPAFIMPRVAVSFVSFLMQVNLDMRIDKLQPARGDASWLDILQECNEMCVYVAVVLNMVVVYTVFYRELKDLGKVFDEELQWFLPLLTLLLLFITYLYVGSTNTSKLSIVTRSVLFIMAGTYGFLVLYRLFKALGSKPKDKDVKQLVHSAPPPPAHPVEPVRVEPIRVEPVPVQPVRVEAIPARVLTPPPASQNLQEATRQISLAPSMGSELPLPQTVPAVVLSSPADPFDAGEPVPLTRQATPNPPSMPTSGPPTVASGPPTAPDTPAAPDSAHSPFQTSSSLQGSYKVLGSARAGQSAAALRPGMPGPARRPA